MRNEPIPGCSPNLDQDAYKELVECNLHKSSWELSLDIKHPNHQSASTWKR